jgi:hypothetical protein
MLETGARAPGSGESTSHVYKKLREKYGARDVKKYYSKFDVALVVALS